MLINNISIGGQPSSYTRLNVDGMSTTGVGGDGRTATLHSFSASNYEQIEIINGQTADKRADSLGGQINLKTRSSFSMSERRRTSYTASGRYFPSWSKRNAAVAERPWRPDFSVSHTEVFDVMGGRRNLGIVVTASYQEVLNPHNWDTNLYENTVNPVAQLRDYTRTSGLNDRFLTAFTGGLITASPRRRTLPCASFTMPVPNHFSTTRRLILGSPPTSPSMIPSRIRTGRSRRAIRPIASKFSRSTIPPSSPVVWPSAQPKCV